jgi:hypothetical protein
MNRKKNGNKAEASSKKSILASVRKEMARPRMVESAHIGTNRPKEPKEKRLV